MTNSNITNASEHFQKLLQQQLDRIQRMEQSEEKTNYAELATIKVGIIGGDGIGPYIAAEAQRVLETLLSDELSNGKVTFQVIDDLTIEKRAEVNQAIPDDVLEKIKKCNVTLKGPTTTPRKGDPWPNIESAKRLALEIVDGINDDSAVDVLEVQLNYLLYFPYEAFALDNQFRWKVVLRQILPFLPGCQNTLM